MLRGSKLIGESKVPLRYFQMVLEHVLSSGENKNQLLFRNYRREFLKKEDFITYNKTEIVII